MSEIWRVDRAMVAFPNPCHPESQCESLAVPEEDLARIIELFVVLDKYLWL